jgi:hypothetical protein
MNIQIVNTPLSITIYGFSGAATDKDYAGKAFQLMDQMWKIVKGQNLKNKGMNIWVYEPGDMVFAGVELEAIPDPSTGLEQKQVNFTQYAYHKHVGPYNLIRQAGSEMTEVLKRNGLETKLPYVEIYGHWGPDESKLETELLMSIR